jgi:hypothetical protein
MKTTRLVSALAAAIAIAACGDGRQNVNPGLPGGMTGPTSVGTINQGRGHLIVMGIKPDHKCPKHFVECVTVSQGQPATLYICYSTAGSCAPSLPEYTWTSLFLKWPHGQPVSYFSGSFNPNPGDPTYDTISEIAGVKPTHGKYKYYQRVCPTLGGGCEPSDYAWGIGIAVK